MKYLAKVIWYGGYNKHKKTKIDYGFAAGHNIDNIFISAKNITLKNRPWSTGLKEGDYITLELKTDSRGRTYGVNVRLLEEDTQYFQGISQLSLQELQEFITKNLPIHRELEVINNLVTNPLIKEAMITHDGLYLFPEEAENREVVSLLLKNLTYLHKIKCTQVSTGKSTTVSIIRTFEDYILWGKLFSYLRVYFNETSLFNIMNDDHYHYENVGRYVAYGLWEAKKCFSLRARAKHALSNQEYYNATKLLAEAGGGFAGKDSLKRTLISQIKKAEESKDLQAIPGLYIELLSLESLIDEKPLTLYYFYKPLISAYQRAGNWKAAQRLQDFANPPFKGKMSLEEFFSIPYNPIKGSSQRKQDIKKLVTDMSVSEKVALLKRLCLEEGLPGFQVNDVAKKYNLVSQVARYFYQYNEHQEALKYYRKLENYYESKFPFREKDYLSHKSSHLPLEERSVQFQNYVIIKDRIKELHVKQGF
ncbi:MAG: hypothetical protein ACOYEO_02950 [bacterium]|jgi:hypothetical protein